MLLGASYCIWISRKENIVSFKELYSLNFQVKGTVVKFIIAALLLALFMYFYKAENFFIVVRKKPLMWVLITIFYSLFSVYPQEFLYRLFYFKRYRVLFKNQYVLIVVNAFVFSLAHIVFMNLLVSVLTLVGGFLFAYTFYKSKSLLLTSLEHALYGSWLFTIGMGEMLAFPMP